VERPSDGGLARFCSGEHPPAGGPACSRRQPADDSQEPGKDTSVASVRRPFRQAAEKDRQAACAPQTQNVPFAAGISDPGYSYSLSVIVGRLCQTPFPRKSIGVSQKRPTNLLTVPQGRGCGVGRGLGSGIPRGVGVGRGVELGVAVGVAVAVAVAVGVAVGVTEGVTVAVGVAVGVGVGPEGVILNGPLVEELFWKRPSLATTRTRTSAIPDDGGSCQSELTAVLGRSRTIKCHVRPESYDP
jgi:hypothetical protein